jgi:hypothetical protein
MLRWAVVFLVNRAGRGALFGFTGIASASTGIDSRSSSIADSAIMFQDEGQKRDAKQEHRKIIGRRNQSTSKK